MLTVKKIPFTQVTDVDRYQDPNHNQIVKSCKYPRKNHGQIQGIDQDLAL